MFDRDAAKVRFPWVAFISQPIGHPEVKLIINPVKFQKLYQIWMLENCLRQEMKVRNFSK
jgi:hypothetical protein